MIISFDFFIFAKDLLIKHHFYSYTLPEPFCWIYISMRYSFEPVSFKSGLTYSIPVSISFSLLFFALGILGHSKGFTLTQSLLMSGGLFAGPTHLYLLTNQNESLWAIGLNVFLLNVKFVMMAIILMTLIDQKKRYLIPGLSFMTNTSYLLTLTQKEVPDRWSFYIALTVPTFLASLFATVVGHYAWHAPELIRLYLKEIACVVLPIHFTCITIKRMDEPLTVLFSVLGFVLSPLLSKVVPYNLHVFVWLAIAALFVTLKKEKTAYVPC